METKGRTIVVTGGGTGIGRGLAEKLHQLGSTVIISGRRQDVLAQVTAKNPGMHSIPLDIQNSDSIREFADQLTNDFPQASVLVNNSGIMKAENWRTGGANLADVEATVLTNLLGPILLTAALLPLLQKHARSTIINVTSGLAFVPLAMTPTYCATKAAIHSWTQSLRYQLKGTGTEVVELAPPYVATELMGEQQAQDPRAMPLTDFLSEVIQILQLEPVPEEILVERVKPLRFASENGAFQAVFSRLNESMPPH